MELKEVVCDDLRYQNCNRVLTRQVDLDETGLSFCFGKNTKQRGASVELVPSAGSQKRCGTGGLIVARLVKIN